MSGKHSCRRVGFLRVLNEEHTIIPCLLSVAPVLDHVAITWSDTQDRSIELARAWEQTILDRFQCTLSFLPYQHHIVPPHSVDDLRHVPVENRIDTYLNHGMKHILDLNEGMPFCMCKVDGDQIYFTHELEKAFNAINDPDSCIALQGHNTLVHQNRFMLYKPRPINGGGDYLICGTGNLPRFGITAPYEVDVTPHPRLNRYPNPCWMHFMRTAKYGSTIRAFHDGETMPVNQSPMLMERYHQYILPLLQEAKSPYAGLRLD